MRKIVQIAAAPAPGEHNTYTQIFALADDGTLWASRLSMDANLKMDESWHQIKPEGLPPSAHKPVGMLLPNA